MTISVQSTGGTVRLLPQRGQGFTLAGQEPQKQSAEPLPSPVPQPCPEAGPLDPRATAIPGKLITGTGCGPNGSALINKALDSVQMIIEGADALYGLATMTEPLKLSDKQWLEQRNFGYMRSALLKHGIRAWIVTSGDTKDQGIFGGGAADLSKGAAENAVQSSLPVTAQSGAMNTNARIIDEFLRRKTYQTNAIVNAASLNEAADLIIRNADGVPTDIIIDGHSGPGGFLFADAEGNDNPVFARENIKWPDGHTPGPATLGQFFDRLKNAGLLQPGLRVKFAGCSFAEGAGVAAELQKYSSRYQIEIVATTFYSYNSMSNISGYISFFPETAEAELSEQIDATKPAEDTYQPSSNKANIPADAKAIIQLGTGSSDFGSYVRRQFPKLNNYIHAHLDSVNNLLDKNQDLAHLTQSQKPGDWLTFCTQLAKYLGRPLN